jgi:hypothetical protein
MGAHLIKLTQIPNLIFSYNNDNACGVKFKDIPVEMYNYIPKIRYFEKMLLDNDEQGAKEQIYVVRLNNITVINDIGTFNISYKQYCLEYNNMYKFTIDTALCNFSFKPIEKMHKTIPVIPTTNPVAGEYIPSVEELIVKYSYTNPGIDAIIEQNMFDIYNRSMKLELLQYLSPTFCDEFQRKQELKAMMKAQKK